MTNQSSYPFLALSCHIKPDELANVLKQTFQLEAKSLLVNTEGDWWLKKSERTSLVCDLHTRGGDFPTCIDLYYYDAELREINNLEAVVRIGEALHCFCLVEDVRASDPYVWVVVYSKEKMQRVLVNRERLDQDHEFVIEQVLGDIHD
jgi:hypothetical protein